MRTKLYILPVFVLLLSSCGEYEQLLKSNDFELKKQKMYDYYNEGKYVRVTELMTQILPRYRATDEAEQLNWINSMANFRLQYYELASEYFINFAELYPMSNNAEEAYFLSALCFYRLSPRAELDQSFTNKGIESFNLFMRKYPESKWKEESREKLKELQEKLVEKSYLNARLYYDLEEYKSATVSLANSLKEYPDTKYREELMFLKLDALFLYAENSVALKKVERYQATLDEYYSFIEEFPESQFSKEISRIFKTTAGFLKIESSPAATTDKN